MRQHNSYNNLSSTAYNNAWASDGGACFSEWASPNNVCVSPKSAWVSDKISARVAPLRSVDTKRTTGVDKKMFGQQAEQCVAHALQKNGFTVLAQNYRTRGGEIDIIASDHDTVVFVEVKARRKQYFDIGQVITPNKQRKITHTAKTYLANHPQLYNKICRFDVALIEQTSARAKVTYIPNAFVA